MANPFRLRWLDGWTFQTVLMEGDVQVEARGFGICLRTRLRNGETPRSAADRLVLEEDRRRRSLHHAWLRGQTLAEPAELGSLPGARPDLPSPLTSGSDPASDRPEQAVGGEIDSPDPFQNSGSDRESEAFTEARDSVFSGSAQAGRTRLKSHGASGP